MRGMRERQPVRFRSAAKSSNGGLRITDSTPLPERGRPPEDGAGLQPVNRARLALDAALICLASPVDRPNLHFSAGPLDEKEAPSNPPQPTKPSVSKALGRRRRDRSTLLLRSRSPGSPVHERLHLLLCHLTILIAIHCFENSLMSRLKLLQ
jgi:hypothetical protein